MRHLPALIIVAVVLSACSSSAGMLQSLPSRTCSLLAQRLPDASDLRPPLDGTLLDHLTGFFTLRATSDVIVFLQADASSEAVESVRRTLENDQRVEAMTYLDHDAAHADFQSIFSDQPNISNSLTVANTPTSFQIRLRDARDVQSMHDAYQSAPSVYEVIALTDASKQHRVTQLQDLKPRFDELHQAGMTAALAHLVDADERLANDAEQHPDRKVVGQGGLFSDGDAARFADEAKQLTSEVTRDCAGGASS